MCESVPYHPFIISVVWRDLATRRKTYCFIVRTVSSDGVFSQRGVIFYYCYDLNNVVNLGTIELSPSLYKSLVGLTGVNV